MNINELISTVKKKIIENILLEEINCTLKINKLVIVIAPCPQMVIITAPIKGFLPKIKGGNCHIPISQKVIKHESPLKMVFFAGERRDIIIFNIY